MNLLFDTNILIYLDYSLKLLQKVNPCNDKVFISVVTVRHSYENKANVGIERPIIAAEAKARRQAGKPQINKPDLTINWLVYISV